VCMTRTNIEIDDDLIARVMKKYDLKTKRDAVDFALRQVAGPESVREALLSLHGIGWDGDLEEMRHDPFREW
jgi:Arc/MetJ family transcription regulator